MPYTIIRENNWFVVKEKSKLKTVAVVPMKLNNRRLSQKNTKVLANGKPLCQYILNTLLNIKEIDEVYVYCSNEDIKLFLPEGVKYLKRSEHLDTDTASMSEVLKCFADDIDADIYVMTHTTAPFISSESIEKGLRAVKEGDNDSALAVKKVQDFLWENGRPFNYDLDNIPRTQDLSPLYMETSGFYIYERAVIKQKGRRVGDNPFLVEVGEIESVDIDEAEDFLIAEAIFNYIFKEKE